MMKTVAFAVSIALFYTLISLSLSSATTLPSASAIMYEECCIDLLHYPDADEPQSDRVRRIISQIVIGIFAAIGGAFLIAVLVATIMDYYSQ